MAETISLSLGDSADPRLSDLIVQTVVPTPDGGRLLVVARPTEDLSLDSLDELYEALNAARGWLRCQIASEIHRKRVPELTFRILPPWEPDR